MPLSLFVIGIVSVMRAVGIGACASPGASLPTTRRGAIRIPLPRKIKSAAPKIADGLALTQR
jgi:hypothetical protein